MPEALQFPENDKLKKGENYLYLQDGEFVARFEIGKSTGCVLVVKHDKLSEKNTLPPVNVLIGKVDRESPEAPNSVQPEGNITGVETTHIIPADPNHVVSQIMCINMYKGAGGLMGYKKVSKMDAQAALGKYVILNY